MTAETQPATPPDWFTQQVRLSGHTHPSQPASLARDWWHALTGGPPDKVTEEPRMGNVELYGTHEHGPLTLYIDSVGRLDITHPFEKGNKASLPAFASALPLFMSLMSRWLDQDSAPGFRRLGFSGLLIKHCPRIEDCRRELDHYLPSVDMQATQTTGFMYQVNHVCPARAIDGLMINRIVRWEIWESQMPSGEAVFAVHLALDINTAPEHTGGLDHSAELFAEMANYAGHFAQGGDRP